MIKLKSLLKEDNTQQPSLSNFKYEFDEDDLYWFFSWDVNNFQHRLIDITKVTYSVSLDGYDLEDYDDFDSFMDEEPGYGLNEVGVQLDGYKGQPGKGIPGTAMPDLKNAAPGFVWYRNGTSNDIILPVIAKLLNQVPWLQIDYLGTSEYGMQSDDVIHCDMDVTKNDIVEKWLRKYFANKENM